MGEVPVADFLVLPKRSLSGNGVAWAAGFIPAAHSRASLPPIVAWSKDSGNHNSGKESSRARSAGR